MPFDESYKRILHRLDYYNYQHGLIVRHLNQGTSWDSHLEKCRQFILKALEIHKPETITVLGSGWLLELPLVEMIDVARSINLVDIVHPPEVVRQTGAIPCVNLLTEDITGGLIEIIWKETSRWPFYRKLKSVKGIRIPEYAPGFDPGMIISLNLLSQLDVLPVRYLQKKSKISDQELLAFRMEIQKKHFDFLGKHKSVLITDVAEVFTFRNGNTEEKETVITQLPSGILREDWIWDFDPHGYDFNEKRSVLKVVAIIS